MILSKNITKQKQHQQDCYTREEFYKILSGGIDARTRSSDSGQKEHFSDFEVKDDSLDFTLWFIFYPLPLVKEIYIKNWAGGWESDQSMIHIEYWDNQWKMRRVLRIYTIEHPKRLEEIEEIITKEDIFPQIIRFILHIDEEKGKKLLRHFNLLQLL
jgi:hypothetical protein